MTESTENEGTPEVVPANEDEELQTSYVSAPKLLRITSMTRAMLEELRQSELDEAGRRRLVEIYDRSLEEMQDVLSPDLREELSEMFVPLEGDISEAELRIVQAQLVGWLEGLFAGIQATLISQQAAAANQLQQMRTRAIEAPGRRPPQDAPGQYL